MDCKKLKKLEIIGAIAVVVGSFLFHFLFEWTGGNRVIALVSAVNESIWEHVKIVFFPYLIFTIVEYFILKPDLTRYLAAKMTGLVFIPLAMISFYYTYSGILGFRITALDIASAVVWSILAFVISYKMYCSNLKIEKIAGWMTAIGIIFTLMLFFFTYFPPHIALFQDGLTGQFGI